MGPIIIIEDDADDQEIMKSVLTELNIKSEIVFFDNAEKALEYLSDPNVIPFIIFSDINMPVMNGFQLRDRIHADPDLRIKCIPYLFLTTGGESKMVWDAYSKSAQGFFIKPTSMTDWRALMDRVVNYWQSSKKPMQ